MSATVHEGFYHEFQARKGGVYRRPLGQGRRWRKLEPEVLNCLTGGDITAAQRAIAEYEQKYLKEGQ